MPNRLSAFSASITALAFSLLTLATVGCGVNTSTGMPTGANVTSLSGFAHGGPSPVVGATVNLYATTSNGYGAAPTLLGTAITGSAGNFNFVTPLPCTAGQQAYVTAYGGNPGSGTNPNYLLMAALGPCSTISSATYVWIDEVTTVAAAYALRPFTTIASVAGVPLVQIGAPANNNAPLGTCTTTSNATTGCTAAGLAHAFANALNLVNSVSINGVAPTGTAYQVTPSNPSGVVPTALINSIADSVESCVNSAGGASGDGSACGNLFLYTTPPPASATVPTNTLQALLNLAQYPTLTAANVTNLFNSATPVSFYLPALTAQPTDFSMAVAYNGVTIPGTVGTVIVNAAGSGYTSVPAVSFQGGGTPTTSATGTAVLSLVSLAFTANTVASCTAPVVKFTGGGFVNTATATATASGGVITAVTITNPGSGYTSLPVVTFTGTNCTTGILTPSLGLGGVVVTNPGAGYSSAPTVAISGGGGAGTTVTANYSVNTFGAPFTIALDANDDLYVGSQNVAGTTGGAGFITAISANGSSIFSNTPSTAYTAPRGIGIDTLGHAWVTANNTLSIVEYSTATGAQMGTFAAAATPFGIAIDRANNVWYGVPASTTQDVYELQQSTGYANAIFTVKPVYTNATRGIAVDANQNIWASGYGTSTDTTGVFPNTGTPTAPVYGTTSVVNTPLTGNTGAAIAIDASGNAWTASSTGLFEIIPTSSGSPAIISSVAQSSNSPIADNASAPLYDDVDGAGNIWLISGVAFLEYVPSTSTVTTFSPCYAPAGAQTCVVSLSVPQRDAIDSTGSVWITSQGNGRIYQLIGTGSPTWPQLSLGAPGVMPQ